MLKILLFLFFTISLGNCFSKIIIKDYTGYKVFKIIPRNEIDLDLIEKLIHKDEFDFWSVTKLIGIPSMVMVEPQSQPLIIEIFQRYNMSYDIFIDNVERTIDNERQNQKIATRFETPGISFDRYYRMEEINNYLYNLTMKYPNLTEVITIGKSYENRNLNVLKISTGGNVNKPALLIDGGIHAREWITPSQALYIIQQLVENSTAYKDLTDQLDWYILPVVNPDGYEFTHTSNRLWRKTRSVNPKSICRGTDANRNYDFHWNEVGASSLTCSDNYAGSVAFSEPEAKYVSEFGLKIKNLKFYLNMHSFGQLILYPWGYTNQKVDNDEELKSLGENANKAMKRSYKVGPIYDTIYPASGSTIDWFKAVAKVNLSYGIELPGGGTFGFDLPAWKIKDVVTDTFQGILVFAEYVKQMANI